MKKFRSTLTSYLALKHFLHLFHFLKTDILVSKPKQLFKLKTIARSKKSSSRYISFTVNSPVYSFFFSSILICDDYKVAKRIPTPIINEFILSIKKYAESRDGAKFRGIREVISLKFVGVIQCTLCTIVYNKYAYRVEEYSANINFHLLCCFLSSRADVSLQVSCFIHDINK